MSKIYLMCTGVRYIPTIAYWASTIPQLEMGEVYNILELSDTALQNITLDCHYNGSKILAFDRSASTKLRKLHVPHLYVGLPKDLVPLTVSRTMYYLGHAIE